jgi:ArsR family transcriptional regulator
MDDRLRQEILQMHAQVCSGLADTNRIMILYALDQGPAYVNDLAAALDLPQSTVSRHLKILRERRMVLAQRTGQSRRYSLRDRRIIAALDLLREVMAASIENQASLVQAINSYNEMEPGVDA